MKTWLKAVIDEIYQFFGLLNSNLYTKPDNILGL